MDASNSVPAAESRDFTSDVQQLEAKVASVPGGGTVFYGSSSIRLWPRLSQSFPAITTLNLGFGGSTLAECAYYFERLVVPLRPRAIVLYAGDNDLAMGAQPMDVYDSLVRLLDLRDRHLGAVPLVCLSLKHCQARLAMLEQIRETNEGFQREIWGRAAAVWVNVHDAMLDEYGAPRSELYAADQLHLSRQGYVLWTEILRRDAAEILDPVTVN